jgi:uncharacterized protein YbjT (DUF2867 family)
VTSQRDVVVTGGTGYIGGALVPALVERGHRVRVIARAASRDRVPRGAEAVVADVLDPDSVAPALHAGDTVVHLVGTPHPSPAKAAEFVRVDLGSIGAVATAASRAIIGHLVYLSVAHPAPVMRAYIEARVEGERIIRERGLTATIIRPWYVLGPGHRWPAALLPIYALARLVPSLRAGADRLGLVTLGQIVATLVDAIENPPTVAGTVQIFDVGRIRAAR